MSSSTFLFLRAGLTLARCLPSLDRISPFFFFLLFHFHYSLLPFISLPRVLSLFSVHPTIRSVRGKKKKNKKRGIHYFNREKLRQRLDVDDDDDDYDEREKERRIEITLLANVIDLRRSTLVRAVNFLFASFFLSFFLSLFDFRYRRVRRNSTHEFITIDLRLRHFRVYTLLRVYTPRFLFPEIFSTLFRFSLLSERFVIA